MIVIFPTNSEYFAFFVSRLHSQIEYVKKKRCEGKTIRQRGLHSAHRNRQWFRRFTGTHTESLSFKIFIFS